MDQDNQFNAVPEEGVPAPALDAQTVKYLLFCSDNLLFGVSADYVVEIITNRHYQAAPGTKLHPGNHQPAGTDHPDRRHPPAAGTAQSE